MTPEKTTVIFGPPGCGKTTTLLNIVDDLMLDDCEPEEICFVTFTRKAANEAKSRAMDKFKLEASRLPLFRTLHSLAFQQLNIRRSEVMAIRDYIAIATHLGIYLTCKGINEDGTIAGLSKGDRLLFMSMMARSRRIPLKEYWETYPNEDIRWYELEVLDRTIREYKKENMKIDFIDMIENFITSKHKVGLKKLIVDEAQDLSTIQWQMVDILSEGAEHVYIAGDDDQAIFQWAGADTERFMGIQGSRRVLEQSYRVPSAVQDIAIEICSRVTKRVPKIWKSREDGGGVQYVNSLSQIDMSKGTWYLLARNIYLLEQFNEHCTLEGYVFSSMLGSPCAGAELEAIAGWEELRRGKSITVHRVAKVYDMMSSRVGVAHGCKSALEREQPGTMINMSRLQIDFGLLTTKIWHEALDRIPEKAREYFISALRRGEKLLKEPRIRISTIHGVKGGEADNVVVCTDMAQRTFKEYHENPDAEARVFYVAVTRAREKLFIMNPTTNIHFKI